MDNWQFGVGPLYVDLSFMFFCFFKSFIYPGLQIGVRPFYIDHQQLPYDAVI